MSTTPEDSDVIERVTEMMCDLAELGYYRSKEIAEALAAAGLLAGPVTVTTEQRDTAARISLAHSIETITDSRWQWERHQRVVDAILADLGIEVSE